MYHNLCITLYLEILGMNSSSWHLYNARHGQVMVSVKSQRFTAHKNEIITQKFLEFNLFLNRCFIKIQKIEILNMITQSFNFLQNESDSNL